MFIFSSAKLELSFHTFAAMSSLEKYEAVIGLEVHTQLLTKSKLFCGDSTMFGNAPNTNVSPVSLAHPGTLPVMNKKAIDYAIKLGLAFNCNIVRNNYFARKNYFYPDLPKGYQVSQHTTPICKNGYVTINIEGIQKNILLNRIHLEMPEKVFTMLMKIILVLISTVPVFHCLKLFQSRICILLNKHLPM